MSLESSSSFGRFAQRDERRRRLLSDDLGAIDNRFSDDATDSSLSPARSVNYGNAEFLQQQLRWLDLVPRRFLVLVMLLTAGAGAIVALEIAYDWMARRAEAGAQVVAALDVLAKGSLACWFSSLALLAATITALMIHSIRKHRADDYQGHYRVWFWAAVGLAVMATDQAASLREALREAMVAWTGVALWSNGELWWVAVYGLLFVAIGSRLLIDIRGCRTAFAGLLAAAMALGMATAIRLGWFMPVEGRIELAMFRSACEMAGNLLLLISLGFYARHVILDAEGVLPQKKRKMTTAEAASVEDDKADDAGASSGSRWRKLDPPHATPRPALQWSGPTSGASDAKPAAQPAAASTPLAPLSRKLTKAEKKALKERLLRQRLARERGE